jgi:hypothetical protein
MGMATNQNFPDRERIDNDRLAVAALQNLWQSLDHALNKRVPQYLRGTEQAYFGSPE